MVWLFSWTYLDGDGEILLLGQREGDSRVAPLEREDVEHLSEGFLQGQHFEVKSFEWMD